MTQSSMVSNDPEINQLITEVLDSLKDMDFGELKSMMLCGAIVFRTAKGYLDEMEAMNHGV